MVRQRSPLWQRNPVLTLVLALIVVWLLFSVLGLLIKGLFYLFVLGVVAIVATLAWSAYSAGRRSR